MSDDYLDRLDRELDAAGFDESARRRIVTEIDSHIRDALTADRDDGDIVARLGDPRVIADSFRLSRWLGVRQRTSSLLRRMALTVLVWVAAAEVLLHFRDAWPGHHVEAAGATSLIWAGVSLALAFSVVDFPFGEDPFGRTPRQQRLIVATSWTTVAGGFLAATGMGLWTLGNRTELPGWFIGGAIVAATLTLAHLAGAFRAALNITFVARRPIDDRSESVREMIATLMRSEEISPPPKGGVGRFFARFDIERFFYGHPVRAACLQVLMLVGGGAYLRQPYADHAGGGQGLFIIAAGLLVLYGEHVGHRRPHVSRSVRS